MLTLLRLRRIAVSLGALALLLAACGGDSNGQQVSGACTVAAEKSALLATAQDWYLYQDLLPASVDPSTYATPSTLLEALTKPARDAGKDREWSFLLTKQAAQQYFTAGQSAGFGVSLFLDVANRLVVRQVFRGSPADQAGFKRGDEILAIGATAQSLVPIATLLSTSTGLSDALGSGTPGTHSFQIQPIGAPGPVVLTATSVAAYDLDPVVSKVLPTPLGNVGYVHLRTFISTADGRLRAAFADFKAQGVQSVIVDVRYNGGGLLSTAQVLGSLLHPIASDLMYRFAFNPKHPDQNENKGFSTEASGSLPVRIAFITSGDSASASELVPNALIPYLGERVAIVGDRTYGKPVGQAAFDLGERCADSLYLISFALQNKDGYGGYYSGLPGTGFQGTSCQAADDLTHEQGDAAEDSTQKALAFVATGSCGSPPITPAALSGALRAAARSSASLLRSPAPTPAQRDVPGLY